jgi:virulence-associated protein VagC
MLHNLANTVIAKRSGGCDLVHWQHATFHVALRFVPSCVERTRRHADDRTTSTSLDSPPKEPWTRPTVRTSKTGRAAKATGRVTLNPPAHTLASVPQRIRAQLFLVGRSQAVRLPRTFRFPGTEVFLYRRGKSVVLEPVPQPQWPAGYWEAVDAEWENLSLGRNRGAASTHASAGQALRRRRRTPRGQPK